MNITDMRIRKMISEGKMRAVISVTFDNCFVVHDIKVVEGKNGLFMAMPSRKTPEGDYRDIAHPIDVGTRAVLQEQVLAKYYDELDLINKVGGSM